jgi:hypothetical protein
LGNELDAFNIQAGEVMLENLERRPGQYAHNVRHPLIDGAASLLFAALVQQTRGERILTAMHAGITVG